MMLGANQRQEYRVAGLSEPVSHYTDAVVSGGLAFLSGFLATDQTGRIVGGDDVVRQADQVHANLAKALEAVGSKFADVLKVTVFVKDINDREAINTVRRRYFGEARPASTLVEISELVDPTALLEIEAVAVVRSRGVSVADVTGG